MKIPELFFIFGVNCPSKKCSLFSFWRKLPCWKQKFYKVFSLFLLEITLLKQKLFLLHCQVYILYLIFGDNYPAKSVIEFALLKIKVWGGNPTPIHEAICHIPRSTPFYLCKIKSIVPELANQDIFRKKLSTFLWTPIFQLWFCKKLFSGIKCESCVLPKFQSSFFSTFYLNNVLTLSSRRERRQFIDW